MDGYALKADVIHALRCRVQRIIGQEETAGETLWADERTHPETGEETINWICRGQWVLTSVDGGAFLPMEATGVN